MKNIIKIIFMMIFVNVYLFSNEKVTLQLKWFHQFQFAGYYAAKEKGYYKDVGLDVTIKQRDLKYNNVQEVIDGKAQYGIADSVLLLYKARQEPVVLVSPIFQHSPSVLISLKSKNFTSPYELNDKDIMFYPNDTDGFSLLSMFKKLKVDPHLIRKKGKDDYLDLINEKFDLLPVYLANEPFYFKEKNIPINIIDPRNYGFDLYGDMLFTNEDEANNHPNRVKRFKEATLKGWRYALANKEEIIQLIKNKYNVKKSISHLRYEADVIEDMIGQKTIPLGALDKGRVQYIYDLYKEYGLSTAKLDVKDFIFEQFNSDGLDVELTKQEKEYLKNNPILRVQNMSTFAPFNFYDKGVAQGYTIDYMRLMAKYLGVDIEFVNNKSWKEFLEMLKNGSLDIIPHIAKNEERKKFVNFTNIEHVEYVISMAVKKGSEFKSFSDLKDKTIAVLNKSFLHTYIKNKYPNQKLMPTKTIGEGVEAVSLGTVDAVIDNVATIQYYIQKKWLSNLKIIDAKDLGIPSKTSLFMGVNKDNHILRSILEKTYDVIPSSKVLELKQKWMEIDETSKATLNTKELKYLSNKKEIKMCIDPDWMPFEKLEKGKHIGMSADYISLLQNSISIPISLVPTKSWVESLEYGKQRKCDIFSLVMATPERKNYLDFTKPYLQIPIIIATSIDQPFINDVTSVFDKKLGIVRGYAFGDILRQRYPNINIVDVDNITDGLDRVKSGELFGFIGTLSTVGFNIQKKYIGALKIAGKFNDTWDLGIGVRSDEPILRDIFDKAIDSVTTKQHQSILNKWISVNYQKGVDYTLLWQLSGVFALIVGFILYNNISMKKVNKKLEKANDEINTANKKMEKYIDLIDSNILTSTTDLKGHITYVSQAFCDISGYTKDELMGKSHNIVRHPDMPNDIFKGIWKNLKSEKPWCGELKNKRKDGSFYWVDATIMPVYNDDGKVIEYTAIRQDITDKKKVEELSITDQLTKLYNRLKLEEVFDAEIDRAKRYSHPFSVILLDIDHFKSVNDTYGHDVGDETLRSVADILRQSVRKTDIVGRWGGEEFIIIASETNLENTLLLAEKIRKNVEEFEFKVIGQKTSSFGVSTFNIDDTQETLVKRSDEALYVAKENGRNRVETIEKV